MKNGFFLLTTVCLIAMCVGAHAVTRTPAPTLDMLVADLASGDDARQVRARQLLPLAGPRVAAKMLPLLDDQPDAVVFAAWRVLEDVIHETELRGEAHDRERVRRDVFSLLAPNASDRRKEIGLRLLPLVVKEEHSLVHVAALLTESRFRERARMALEASGTRNALAVLCDALPGAEGDFKIHLLRAIFAFDPGDQQRRLTPWLEDPSPAVQAAALRALARTGNPALLSQAQRICHAASPDNAFDAWDGWLRLADALALRGGHWEAAMAAYRNILATTPYSLIASGAVTGLGRHGDDTVVAVIVEALCGDDGPLLEGAALEAFRSLHGRAAHQAMAAAYPGLSLTMKVGLLAIFAEKDDPMFLELVAQDARHEDTVIQQAARKALRHSGTSEAVAVFLEILDEASDPGERAATLDNLTALALELQRSGDATGAGRTWLAIYRHANDDATRAEALEGVRRHPVPEAFDVVLDLLASGDIESLPVDTMFGIALNAIEAGREEDGKRILDEIMPKLTTADAVRRAAHVMRARGPDPAFARMLGVINRWHFVGPFPWNPSHGFEPVFIGEPNVNLDEVYTVDDAERPWHVAETGDALGIYDLIGAIGAVENAVVFAYVEIETAESGPAQLRLGSDDGVRVWINGEGVIALDVDRGYDIDQDIVEIHLKEGRNALLVQITQRMGGWAFGARLTHPDGRPLEFNIVE